MALDGIVIAALVKELRGTIEGGHISKISMPEKNELFLTVKNHSQVYRLLISSDASLPLIYLSPSNKTSPPSAPGFCMLLRKHSGSARITEVRQLGLERIICIRMQQLNELGDLSEKRLYIELMGKYSNMIFTDDSDVVIDSMKRVPSSLSSLREVLPGRSYYLPEQLKKLNPLEMKREQFAETLGKAGAAPLDRALVLSLSGISPPVASELLRIAGLEERMRADALSPDMLTHLFQTISLFMEEIRSGSFSPVIYLKNGEPVEFSTVRLGGFASPPYAAKEYGSVSALLFDYYELRNSISRIRQKSADLRRLVQNLLDRGQRKYLLQEKQLRDTQKKEKYRVWGDLLNTYGYQLQGGEAELSCENYYDGGKLLNIPLDTQLSASQNAKRYYDRYAKLKRTEEAVGAEIGRTRQENEHLTSILASLELATEESDLNQVREELAEYKYIRGHGGKSGKKRRQISRPLHFVSSDGFDIYVGKNNYQNEELTFQLASGSDWWFHAKGMPGSHVIVKCGREELPDRCFEEAASLAAYYSKGRDAEKVEIDYIQRRFVKKVAGGPPGFVIYHSNWSMMAKPAAKIPPEAKDS